MYSTVWNMFKIKIIVKLLEFPQNTVFQNSRINKTKGLMSLVSAIDIFFDKKGDSLKNLRPKCELSIGQRLQNAYGRKLNDYPSFQDAS